MIRLKHIYHQYQQGGERMNVLSDLNLDIPKGQWLMIVGKNGSGKSTIMKLISGATTLQKGSIYIDGLEIGHQSHRYRSRYVSQVFQNPSTGIAPQLTILENFRIASLRGSKRSLWKTIDRSFISYCKDELATLKLGLEDKIHQLAGTLSGGQMQALSLLMAVSAPCDLLLMDEPTAALDPHSAELVMLRAEQFISERRLTCITVTHQMKEAVGYGDRIVRLDQGAIKNDLLKSDSPHLEPKDLLDWFE